MQEKEFFISLNSRLWINDLVHPILEGTYDRFKIILDKDSGEIKKLSFRKLNLQVDEFDGDSLVFKEHQSASESPERRVLEDCSKWPTLKRYRRPNPGKVYLEAYGTASNHNTKNNIRANRLLLEIGGVTGFTIETTSSVANFQTTKVISVTRNNKNELIVAFIDGNNHYQKVPFDLSEICRITLVS